MVDGYVVEELEVEEIVMFDVWSWEGGYVFLLLVSLMLRG